MVKREFHVLDMHCVSCKMRLEGLEDDLPGIRQISASYYRQSLTIVYDEGLVSEAQIIQAAKDLGYHLSVTETL